jgi:hypothetical protein
MAPVCLGLARVHVLAGVLGGAIAYCLALAAMGGLRPSVLLSIRTSPAPAPAPLPVSPARAPVASR